MKADTMNEKTIELPPLPELPRGAHNMLMGDDWEDVYDASQMNAHYIAGFEAGRSRAASEPGEVARLRDALRAIAWSNDSKWQADCANSALASMATSPASEAQAGWVMVPREPTPEMLAAAQGVFGHPLAKLSYRAMLASAPLPASSPVAAEGQKAALTHEQITKFGLGLEYVHSVLRWAACGYVHTPERIASLHTSYRIVDRIINATPTASMADAAEAVQVGASEEVLVFAIEVEKMLCKKLGRSWSAVGISIESLIDELATPGPRGENAGGVVEAWQPIESAPKDGTSVMGYWIGGKHDCAIHATKFHNGRWWEPNENFPQRPPTHWMPLPATPTEEQP